MPAVTNNTFQIDPPSCFYLGRDYDLKTKELGDNPVLLPASHFTTHAVVVGMTGSGKTGLCISLLEEAAIDGIPSIIVDLKGDLSNLFLQFPDLKPTDFQPWVDPEEAKKKGISQEAYAEQTAAKWKAGLSDWHQQPERIERLKNSSDWRLYTPGSSAGRAVSILRSFAAPSGNLSREELGERVSNTATAVLGLIKISGDSLQSREHILISNLLQNSWSKGQSLDLQSLIIQIQNPPMNRIGAFDMETFYPEADRLKLAVALNNILASPGFASWIEGEQLDIHRMVKGDDGKPCQNIFYLAHLDDAERMFFLTLLLTELIGWMRTQPGTGSLRMLLYVDEVFGYLPPHPANPPSRQPFLTLLKQARAFGIGVVLATQNPVDLDYKALTNTGTWFVGKLQTERDKARLMEGLQGVANTAGSLSDPKYLDKVISSLGNRVFLLHSVHEPKPRIMHTRWAMSYLAGPLTKDQIAQLPGVKVEETKATPTEKVTWEKPPGCTGQNCPLPTLPATAKFCGECGGALKRAVPTPEVELKTTLRKTTAVSTSPASNHPPLLPSTIRQYYLNALPLSANSSSGQLRYKPRLLGVADVDLANTKLKLDLVRQLNLLAAFPEPGAAVSWAEAVTFLPPVENQPEMEDCVWDDLPKGAGEAKKLTAWEKEFTTYLVENLSGKVLRNVEFDWFSNAGETPEAFRQRCKMEAMRRVNNECNEMIRSLEIRRAHIRQMQEKNAAEPSADLQSQIDIALADDQTMQKAYLSLTEQLKKKWLDKANDLEEVPLVAKKKSVRLSQFGLVWIPYWYLTQADGSVRSFPAFARPAVLVPNS